MRRRLADERGLTIVEGVIASLILVIGALGALQIFDVAKRTTFRTEESQTLNNRLQAELEEMKDLPFGELALNAAPGSAANENDPRSRVEGTNFALNRNGSGVEPLVVDADEGQVDPNPESFQIGDISGEIFKFVVWRDDPTCGTACGANDMKRVIVAARVDEAPVSFPREYQEAHSDVVDPDVSPDSPGSGGGPVEDEPTVAEFWLTDTPCSFGQRQPITADHLGHNTRARCGNGAQTGTTRGAPDLMYTEAPALDPNYPPDGQPLFDYATDSEPTTGGATDKGLLMPWSNQDSCLLEPVFGLTNIREAIDGLLDPILETQAPGALDGLLDLGGSETDKHLRMHTWLSPAVTNSGGILTGDATLELWTKTVNGASHPGSICISLFIRREIEIPRITLLGLPLASITIEADVPVINTGDPGNLTHFSYSQASWPRNWTEISVPMEFIGVDSAGLPVPLSLPQGSRVGMTLMSRRTGTQPGQALEFLYDHPSFDSRLQLQTNQVIGF